MLISTSIFNSAVEKFKNLKEFKEGYHLKNFEKSLTYTFTLIYLIIAIIFFLLELLVLIYSLQIAVTCVHGPERVIHFVLAITFTLPYALVNIIFNPCAISLLRKPKLFTL